MTSHMTSSTTPPFFPIKVPFFKMYPLPALSLTMAHALSFPLIMAVRVSCESSSFCNSVWASLRAFSFSVAASFLFLSFSCSILSRRCFSASSLLRFFWAFIR